MIQDNEWRLKSWPELRTGHSYDQFFAHFSGYFINSFSDGEMKSANEGMIEDAISEREQI